ncbi:MULTISPECIES: peptidoglycan editing factor PgeF [Mycetohabitans]|uniref:peptidoglycan editing factor PgeF n=1 Tax=Mycetohabitans TaxID=2571159 RepID=UPI001F1CD295|nr:peptidoglycan editing factor PgeF [Mycetohabitans sp. B3]MCF2133597.1 peptidoglycan editing factor PgeF [Mycetohabitans sp. B3]
MNPIGAPTSQRFAELTLSDCIVPDWRVSQRVCALMTTRAGGVSCGAYGVLRNQQCAPGGLNLGLHTGDDMDAVRENRRRVLALVGAHAAWLEQVHGTRVVSADEVVGTDLLTADALGPKADASVTDRAGVVCAILVADCMPVLICDEAGRAVGAAHAGWRGLVGGVVEHTVGAVRALLARHEHAPGVLHAYLGPSIGPCAFEVGEEVRAAFLDASLPDERDATDAAFVELPSRAIDDVSRVDDAADVHGDGRCKYFGNLGALARLRLARVGVHHVSGPHACTFSDPARFYSYRRDRTTGRMAALIWLA